MVVSSAGIELTGRGAFTTPTTSWPARTESQHGAPGWACTSLTSDDEPGAEVYTAATKLDQARIIHSESIRMVESAPQLGIVQVYRNSLSVRETYSKFEPIASDSDKLDGLNAHAILNDELHAWPNRDLWDVLDTSTGSRRNWLDLEYHDRRP